MMAGKILGIGGVFFKSADPKALIAWYQKWLSLAVDDGYVVLPLNALPKQAYQVWSPFKSSTEYFSPSTKQTMFNFIVDDVASALAQVIKGGADVVGEPESNEFGDFGWFIDPGWT